MNTMASKPNSSPSLTNNSVAKTNEGSGFLSKLQGLLNDPLKRWWVIAPSLVILAALIAVSYYELVYLPAHKTTRTTLLTSVARRGDITLSASGTGTLQPANQVQLGFGGNTSGKLVTLNVKVSDVVKEGQLLAEIDNTADKINYEQAQRTLVNLTSDAAIATAQQDIATASAAVTASRDNLVYLISPDVYYWQQQVSTAQQALDDAKSNAGPTPTADQQKTIDTAQAKLKYYQDSLSGSYIRWEKTYVPIHFTVVTRFNHVVTKQVQPPTDAEIAAKQSAYLVAQASLQEAQWYLDALNGKDIPVNATGTNLAALETAKLNVQSAKASLDATQIYAPVSGTIMSVSAQLGDNVSSSAIIVMGDLSQLYIQTYVDQSDYQMFKVGNEADILFDALPDQSFTGKVIEVDPALDTSSGSAVVSGLVKMDPTKANLLMGMSASVDIIGSQAQNAILIPLTALHEESPGKYSVMVRKNGKFTAVDVEVGLKDLVNAQITSGLQQGDVVSTSKIGTTQP